MHLEIGSPAILPLAFAKIEEDGKERTVVLGAALQHPPVHLFAAESGGLSIYGPRAHISRAFANRFFDKTGQPKTVELRIENTTPSLVGFGSDMSLAMATAEGIAWVNGKGIDQDSPTESYDLLQAMDLDFEDPLSFWGVVKGGMLIVELESEDKSVPPRLIRRQHIKHKDHQAWAFVYHFPPVPTHIDEGIEQERLLMVKKLAPLMPTDSGKVLLEELWPAVEADDLDAFGTALMRLRDMNLSLIEKEAGSKWLNDPDHVKKVESIYKEEGAVAWGESFTGLGLFSIVFGSLKSQEIRKRMLREVGYGGGLYDATVIDNDGLKHSQKQENLHLHDYKLPNTIPGVSGPKRNAD